MVDNRKKQLGSWVFYHSDNGGFNNYQLLSLALIMLIKQLFNQVGKLINT